MLVLCVRAVGKRISGLEVNGCSYVVENGTILIIAVEGKGIFDQRQSSHVVSAFVSSESELVFSNDGRRISQRHFLAGF